MFLFFRKKHPDDKLYPTFNSRLMAALIDIALATILLVPITNIISSIVYDDVTQTKQQMSLMMKHLSETSDATKSFLYNLTNNPEFQQFMQDKKYLIIFTEQAIQLLVLALIIITFWIKKQTTPGKMLLSLKIVDSKTFEKPTVMQLIIRLCSYVFSIVPLGIGILYILVNKKKRAWHDLISDTVVISEKHLTKNIKNAK
jgi:uncharacterized RDD family membrane protein YckC